MTPESLRAVRIVVRGRVQRVGYRRYLLDLAQELGLTGYAKNLEDGGVEVFCQAESETVGAYLEKIRNPPPPAIVKSIELRDVKPRPQLRTFKIRYGPVQDELQEGFGAMQTVFASYWDEFKDYRQEFRDYRQEFRDFRQEFRDYRQEFREFAKRTDENFKLVLEKYGEISDKLTVILETLVKESKETREMLNETMRLLREALEKLS